MSDDEDYYDEYDEDIFWIEEPDPGVADDLAATANYDAIFFEDPSFEVEEYFSDWDDQSDDYYDEDPTAVRRQRAMGLWPNKPNHLRKADGVKTKTMPTPEKLRTKKSTLTTDIASFQGTVWKTPNDDTPPRQLHEPGDGEKVALLKNWREIFRSSHPALGRTRVRKVAPPYTNDMEPPRSRVGDGKMMDISSDENSGVSSLERLRETDVGSEDVSKTTSPAKSSASPPLTVHARRVVASPSDLPVNSKMLEHEYPIEGHDTAVQSSDPITSVPQPQEPRLDRHNSKSAPAPPVRSRKRKASDSVDDQESNGNSETTTTKPKSKRIASKKVGESVDPPTSSGPVRRSARNKAK
ncbi:hypothetical protein BDV25DRAFT_153253 [Aspergillus avenaceus]|uniref:Uncharacterized protein n=1 Tax=Aspergillus avenaceus TaxID=36643 RepID=A0A5N6TXS8_ASPAV|nr:hypothetical protein BDV25DRAFT_153253 [Aspergillus avenaceus]